MKYLSIILLFILPVALLAQSHQLTSDYHGIRENDSIVKIQFSSQSPGRSGERVIWDFSNIKEGTKLYPLHYFTNSDSILTGREHQTSYHYRATKDTLLRIGYANPTTSFEYLTPELLLTYPFSYQDSVGSYFYGEGLYGGKLRFSLTGKTQTKADGYGMILLPDEVILENVLRVHTQKVFTEKMSPSDTILYRYHNDSTFLIPAFVEEQLAQDSIVLRQETYQWYARGYRYPVFETVQSKLLRYGKMIDYFETTFFYPIVEQIYLEEDKLNAALREEDLLAQQAAGSKKQTPGMEGKGDQLGGEQQLFSYRAYPNPVEDKMRLEIQMREESPLSISVFTLQGKLVQRVSHGETLIGNHQYEIDLSGYPAGEYLLLFTQEEENYSEKIVKK